MTGEQPLFSTLQDISHRLKTSLYLVGGPVRDDLLGAECHDWDMVCRHAQTMAKAAARRLHAKFITLDELNKIYRVILPLPSFRHVVSRNPQTILDPGLQSAGVTTLDFAEIQGQSIERDLARRDFTINAMARRLGSPVLIDPFSGQKDLQKKVIRAVSAKAFAEDPLRLLRAFRFAAQLGFPIEKKTRSLIVRHAPRLRHVAAERIREELLKLLSQPGAAAQLKAMDRSRLLTLLFPELEAGRGIAHAYYGKNGVLSHVLQAVENLEWIIQEIERVSDSAKRAGVRSCIVASTRWCQTQQTVRPQRCNNARPDPSPFYSLTRPLQEYIHHPIGNHPRLAFLKLGVLLHDIGKPATAQVLQGRLRFFAHEEVGAQIVAKRIDKLRFSNQENHVIRLWVRHHMRPGNLAAAPRVTDKAMARFFRDLGEDGVGMLLVSLADHYTYLARSKWGKLKDPVEKLTRQLLLRYYIQREKVLPAKLVNGHVLMKKLKLKSGPRIGKLLEAIQDAQAEGKVKTQEDAIAFAKKTASSLKLQVSREAHTT